MYDLYSFKKHISKEQVIIASIFLICFFFFFFGIKINLNGTLYHGVQILCMVALTICWVYRSFVIREIRRKYLGAIEFKTDKINIASEIYPVETIKEIIFKVFDYRGKNRGWGGSSGWVSGGADNTVRIILRSGEILEYSFKLNKLSDIKEIQDSLIAYMKSGIIIPADVKQILGLDFYQNLQEFKVKYPVEYAEYFNKNFQ